MVSTDGYFFSRREQIVTLAARDKVPTVYDRRGYAIVGGLVSYGPDLPGAYRQIGVYAARISGARNHPTGRLCSRQN